jgi:ribosomal lysine N-methyltransferase 2
MVRKCILVVVIRTGTHLFIVNTRCVYHRLYSSQSHPDNLTLCPLLDLANHTSSLAHASSIEPIPTFFSPSASFLKKGDEVYLRYGPHSSTTLFTEYGFVERDPLHGGQVDVSDILESLFHEKGPLGDWMKTTLQAKNYWGYDISPMCTDVAIFIP